MTNIEHSRPKEHDILEKTQDRVGGIECALQSLSDHPIIKFLKSLFFKKKESEAKKNSIPVSPTGASKSRNDWTGGMSEETYRTILMQAKNAKPEDFDRIIDAIPELPKMTVSADKELTKDAAEAMRKIIHENPATLALHGKLGQEKNTLMKRIKIFTTMAANESEFLDVGKQLSAVREKSLTEGRRLSEGKSLRA
ncbi:hypothetical protein HY213_04435, partial [Candidatus Peregrinibacteria bacterium]|nr:hypothetical protein [Candidatus Peregrinibacteria bacterium]